MSKKETVRLLKKVMAAWKALQPLYADNGSRQEEWKGFFCFINKELENNGDDPVSEPSWDNLQPEPNRLKKWRELMAAWEALMPLYADSGSRQEEWKGFFCFINKELENNGDDPVSEPSWDNLPRPDRRRDGLSI